MERGGCVYIMMNENHTTIYVGVTADLYSRIYQHKNNDDQNSFTYRYNCTKLVWYEFFSTIEEAIAKEKQLKNWHRQWKLDLVMKNNPSFQDLWKTLE
jgi:putative endonuclease